jgi:hypothetical protein
VKRDKISAQPMIDFLDAYSNVDPFLAYHSLKRTNHALACDYELMEDANDMMDNYVGEYNHKDDFVREYMDGRVF